MKVIFLDIDGVLNIIPQGHDKYGSTFHQNFVDNLDKIVSQTGAKIVISSTWRYSGLKVMQNMWKDRNLPGEVIDITPDGTKKLKDGYWIYVPSVPRGDEIANWIKHNDVDNYVIIDDDDDMLPSQQTHFVKTSDNSDHPDCIDIGYGLTRKCADMAIQILNG